MIAPEPAVHLDAVTCRYRTHREAVRFSLEWTIENFKTFRNETESMSVLGITMSELGLQDCYKGRWFISVVPCWKNVDNGFEKRFLSVFLNIWDTNDAVTSYTDEQEIPVEFSIRLTTGKKQQEEVLRDDSDSAVNVYVFSSVKHRWGWPEAISHDDLFGSDENLAWLKDDCITVSMDVVVYKNAQTIQIPKKVIWNTTEHYQNFAAQQLTWYCSEPQRLSRDLDFILQLSDGKEFHTSRWILMAHSPVFAAMLNHDSKETITSRCEMTDVDGETTEIMLDYLYGCSMEKIHMGNVEKILIMADKYQMMGMLHACEELLANTVPVDKAVHLLVLASQRGLEKLKAAALEVIPRNMATVLQNGALEEAMQADPSLMQTIMEHCSKRMRIAEEA